MKPLPAYILAMGIRHTLLKDNKVLHKGEVKDLSVEQQEEVKNYEEDLAPVQSHCRRYVYYQGHRL
jgi:hypothetical protein